MKAIILAAGRGTRMLALTEDVPKCLLQVGGRSILEHQLGLIKVGGISEIAIVTGFGAEKIRKAGGNGITYVHNSEYVSTNSIYSLFLAADHLDSDVLLLNSDVLVGPEIMNLVIGEDCPNAIAVDFDKQLVDGEMNVKVSDGYVSEISKNIPAEDADAESVQLAKLGAESAREFKKEIISLVENNSSSLFPTDAYKPVIEHHGLRAVGVRGNQWLDVDTPSDYEKAMSLNIF